MQRSEHSSILQAKDGGKQEDSGADAGRQTVRRIPSNHRQAERQLIQLVESGELEIDPQGQIWRLKKRMGLKSGGSHLVSVPRQRAEHRVRLGYLQIRGTVDGKRRYGMAHRLVWQYFRGDIPGGFCINHINGVKDDNPPENLEVVSYSENMRHAFRTGLKTQWGETNPAAKVSNADVVEMRQLYATGEYTMAEVGHSFGVSFHYVSAIVRGHRRSKQGGPTDSSDHRRYYSPEHDPATGRFI